MKHTDFAAQLDAYVDGELVGNEARDMEAHARECAACAHTHERHLALRAAIRERLPALRAPGELRSRVRQAVRAAAGVTPAPPQPGRRWLAPAPGAPKVVRGAREGTGHRGPA